jgi:hypothetical protein
LKECQEKAEKNPDIYFYRELLIHSKEKRRVELVTISSASGITAEREPSFVTMFPEKETHPRPFVYL